MTGEFYPDHPEFSGELDATPATPATKRDIQTAIETKAAGGFEMVPGEGSSTQVYKFPGQPERGNFSVTMCGERGWDGRPNVVGRAQQYIPGRSGPLITDYYITKRPDPSDPYGMEIKTRLESDEIFDATLEELNAMAELSIRATEAERAAGLTIASEKQGQDLLVLLNDPDAVVSPPLR